VKIAVRCLTVILLLVLSSLGAIAHQDLTGQKCIVIPHAIQAPVLKGDLSDPAWRSGVIVNDFVSISAKSPVTQQTQARLLWDSKYLYIGVLCSETDLNGMRHVSNKHDGRVWQDDCIEILLDTANAHRTCFHIMANCIGTIADERSIDSDRTDTEWNSACRVKTGRIRGAWTLELALPFSSLGFTPTPGLTWGINICRARVAGAREFSSWSPSPGGFVQPQSFGHAVFGDGNGKWSGIQLLSWGSLSQDVALGLKNVVECSIPNKGSAPATFNVRMDDKVGIKNISITQKKVTVDAGKAIDLDIPYKPSGAPNEVFTLSISKNKAEVFRASHPSTYVPHTSRVWELKDPLFSELLSKTPPGDQKDGTIYWFHNGISYKLRPYALEYGVRYSLEEQYKELAQRRFMPITQRGSLNDPYLMKMADKYEFKVLYQPDYRSSRDAGVPVIDGLPYILDPRSKAAYFNDLRSTLEDHSKYIWGIYTQDEVHEKAIKQGVMFFEQMKDTYPYIREVDEQVRSQFGFGKYGIPTSLNDTNPYRWIAYHKWVNRQLLNWQKDTFEMTRRIAPEVKVISVDPVAGHNPFELDGYTPYVDIATHQLYPSANPNRQEFGFVTKFVADLVNKPVWPCAHVENYAYSTTPEEVRELMSQVMRNGGKGFHLYIPDVRGNSADKCDTLLTKYGCPERYRAIEEILATTYKMNEVLIPKDPDCAMFYSDDHFQSFAAPDLTYPNEPEYAYTFLGPVARTWFKIVNDNMIADGRAKLSTYKALFVPAAKYQRPAVIAALDNYVKNGGTLICGDPEAFSWNTNGSSLESVRIKLAGAFCSKVSKQRYLTFQSSCPLKSLRGRRLPVMADAFDLKPAAEVEVLARFDDGHPAIIRNHVGRGSVIFFAFNPFNESAIGDNNWKDAFRALCSDLGLKTNRDIWRFKFPPFKTVYRPDLQENCLTGNYIKWSQEQPLDLNNIAIPGKYSYSLPPDAVSDRGDPAGISFTTGKLTDRRRAPTVAKSELRPEDFSVTWKQEKPADLTFDLAGSYAVDKINLWYSGQLPSLAVYGSTDGTSWNLLSNNPKQTTTQDVLNISLSWKPQQNIRYVRLCLGDRDPGQTMTLAEVEIWSKK